MNAKIIRIVATLVLFLCVCACHKDHEDMTPPVLALLHPTGTIGVEGDAVGYGVSVSGAAPFTYAWAWPTGISPATSTSSAPSVTLTVPGTYTGSLTVTDTNSEFTTTTYGYTIGYIVPTLTAVSLPIPALPLGTGQFTTVHSGHPTAAEWDFGAGALPATSTELEPTVTFQDPGIYHGTVTLSNPAGDSSTELFEYTVTEPEAPAWTSMSLGPALADVGIGPFINAVVCDDRLAVVHNSAAGLVFSRAAVELPSVDSDWTSHVIDPEGRGYGPQTLVSIGDRLALVFLKPVPDTLSGYYLRIAISTNADPTSSGDWTFHDLIDYASDRNLAALAIITDRLVLVMDNPLPQYWRASVEIPTDVSDWATYRMREYLDGDSLIHPASLTVAGDHLATVLTGPWGGLVCLLSSSLDPDEHDDWSYPIVSHQFGGSYPAWAVVNTWDDRLLVASSSDGTGLSVAFATVDEPTGPDDFTLVTLVPAFTEVHDELSFAHLNGRLALVAHDVTTGELVLWRQVRIDPTVSTAWTKTPLLSNGLPQTVATNLCQLGDKIAVGYIDTISGEARVLISDGPY
ncbi:MAG: PKD domain-containing protein [bacterium]